MSSHLVPLTIFVGTALVGTTINDDRVSSLKFGMGTGTTRGEAVREAVSDAIDALLDEYLEKGWEFDKEEARKVIKNENKFVKNFNITGTTKIGINFGVSVKVIFNTENIDKELTRIKKPIKKDKDDEMKGEKQAQKDKDQKGDKIKIITVEAEGSGASEEEARKNLFQAAIKKAADQLILETKTTNEANKIKEENTNVNIGTIKKVFEIKFIKKEKIIIAKGKVEVESKASQKEEGKKFETVISEGNGKSEEEALQDAIRKGIEKTVGIHIKSVEELKNGIIKETIIEQMTASVSGKKILNTMKNKEVIKITVFFELDTSFIFKNLKEKPPTISKIDGASLAAQIESRRELAKQGNALIDILLDDFFGCNVLVPSIKNLTFSNEGNFELKYNHTLDKQKYQDFLKKWIPVLDKIKIKKVNLDKKEFDKKTKGTRGKEDTTNFNRNEYYLTIYIIDTNENDTYFEYKIPGFINGYDPAFTGELKNIGLEIIPYFVFFDKDEKTVKQFQYIESAKNMEGVQWNFKIRYVQIDLFLNPYYSESVTLKSSISIDELSKVTGIKAQFQKIDIRPMAINRFGAQK